MASNLYTVEHDQQQIVKIQQTLKIQQQAFKETPYAAAESRITDLKNLKKALLQFQTPILQALCDDFTHRSDHDSKMGDIMPSIMAINYAIKNVTKWMKPSKRHIGVLFQPAQAHVFYQPLGVIGIIAPWNYPIFLSLGPLITALAAGNHAMIKMSEFTPKTNATLKKMLSNTFAEEKVALITGGAQVATLFSKQAFDHILFTGSTAVGKKVMAAAAENLTPVTLELGGKSPTLIDNKIDINDAVSRFMLGKCLNAGQTCVAPDYILCPHNRIDALRQSITSQFIKMYPTITENDDYTAIINTQQIERLTFALADARNKGATLVTLGGESETSCLTKNKLSLTIATQVNDEMVIMNEEIFGPILPIVGYDDIDDAIDYVNKKARPLALFLCSHDEKIQQKVLKSTHSGGVCINDAAIHVAQDDLPFGGIGQSGMGQYHGHEGFLTFSNAKSVFKKGKINTTIMAFPPAGKLIHKLIYKLFIR